MKPQDAITYFGTQTKLAHALGMSQSSIAEWVANDAIPEARQYQIELATCRALLADLPALRRQDLGRPCEGVPV
jgi:DNA-binding transcriptional regulator YdaS (Cro superfamily)